MEQHLLEIYSLCSSIRITPHNANLKETCPVTIEAHCAIKDKNGNYNYTTLHVNNTTLIEAVATLHYLIIGYRTLVLAIK